NDFLKEEKDVELICSAFGKHFLDGIIVRGKSLAILSDSILLQSLTNVTTLKVIDYLKNEQIRDEKEQVNVNQFMDEAYDYFCKGLKTHDQLENIFIDEMDFSKADKVADRFIQ